MRLRSALNGPVTRETGEQRGKKGRVYRCRARTPVLFVPNIPSDRFYAFNRATQFATGGIDVSTAQRDRPSQTFRAFPSRSTTSVSFAVDRIPPQEFRIRGNWNSPGRKCFFIKRNRDEL